MYSPLSANWDAAIRSGGKRRTVCDVYTGLPSGLALSDVEIQSFSITVDQNANNRRSGTVTIVNSDLLDLLKSSPGASPLEPYGSEIVIRHGVVYDDDTEELIPLGIFGIEDLRWQEPGAAMVLTVYDRSRIYERVGNWSTGSHNGITASAYISELASGVRSDFDPVVFPAILANFTIPGGSTYRESSRWSQLVSLAEAMGCSIYFDVSGVLNVVAIPYVDQTITTADVAWTIDTGDQGVMITADRGLTRRDSYNKVGVWGAPANENTAQPYAFAADSNPTSLTYYYGPFGKCETNIERQELTTYAQCLTYAQAQLLHFKGLYRSLSVPAISNPALDAGDIILVKFLDDIEELHLVDSFTLDEKGSMTITTRAQQVI